MALLYRSGFCTSKSRPNHHPVTDPLVRMLAVSLRAEAQSWPQSRLSAEGVALFGPANTTSESTPQPAAAAADTFNSTLCVCVCVYV